MEYLVIQERKGLPVTRVTMVHLVNLDLLVILVHVVSKVILDLLEKKVPMGRKVKLDTLAKKEMLVQKATKDPTAFLVQEDQMGPKDQKDVMVLLANLVQLVFQVRKEKSVCLVYPVTKDDEDLRVQLVQLVWMALPALKVNVVHKDDRDHKDDVALAVDPVLVEHLARKDMLVKKEILVKKVLLVPLANRDHKVPVDLLDFQDQKVPKDFLERMVFLDIPVNVVNLVSKARMVLKDLLVLLVHKVRLVKPVLLENVAHLVLVVPLAK